MELASRHGDAALRVRRALALLDIYREGGLTLDQVMAFAVSLDPERQMRVYAQLAPHQRQTYAIRRAMIEAKVPADAPPPRARLVGVDAYVAAGGALLADLPEAAQARLAEIDGQLDVLADTYGFDPREKARAGAFVVLGHDGEARIERGYVRPDDEPPAEVEPEAEAPGGGDGTAPPQAPQVRNEAA